MKHTSKFLLRRITLFMLAGVLAGSCMTAEAKKKGKGGGRGKKSFKISMIPTDSEFNMDKRPATDQLAERGYVPPADKQGTLPRTQLWLLVEVTDYVGDKHPHIVSMDDFKKFEKRLQAEQNVFNQAMEKAEAAWQARADIEEPFPSRKLRPRTLERKRVIASISEAQMEMDKLNASKAAQNARVYTSQERVLRQAAALLHQQVAKSAQRIVSSNSF